MQIPLLFNTWGSWSCSLLVNVIPLFCIYSFSNALDYQISTTANPQRICNSTTYPNASEFESNLNTVLNNLVQHTSSSLGGYNTSVSGEIPNRVYGLLQCRGDLSIEECYNCSQDAKNSILRVCRNAVSGKLWLDSCYVRYDNYSFFGQLDTSNFKALHNKNNTADPDPFSSSVGWLFQNLSNNVFLSKKRFATGSTKDMISFQKINGLVQCWRDISIGDCELCLANAIYKVYLITNRGSCLGGVCFMGSCTARYDVYSFFNETSFSPPPSLPPTPVEAPPSSFPSRTTASTSKKSSKKTILVGCIVGVSLIMLLVAVVVFAKRRKLKASMFGRAFRQGQAMEEDPLMGDGRPTIFNLETLKNATGNFHDDNKLGEGGFGPVYKGTLIDGKEIAVKKLSLKSAQGRQEFLNEVKLVAKLQHKNLVHILGCCAEGSERLLVYEFLPNKSLDKILFDPLVSKQVDWEMRFNIILGIARGLVYLHEDSRERVIHRDIKASNILLDKSMNTKIADFGLAKLFVEDESHVNTRVAGTFGYMAPEYALRGQLSPKADVYSFGVLLLEIVCGRKNTDLKLSAEDQILIELVWRSFEAGHAVDVIDTKIVEKCGHEEAVKCIHVGLLCTQGDVSLRPSMSSVYSMLSNPAISNLPHPTKPAIVNTTSDERRSHTGSSSRASTSLSLSSSSLVTPSVHESINDESITQLDGR